MSDSSCQSGQHPWHRACKAKQSGATSHPSEWPLSKVTEKSKCWGVLCTAGGNGTGGAAVKKWQLLKELKVELPYDLAIPLPCMDPKDSQQDL